MSLSIFKDLTNAEDVSINISNKRYLNRQTISDMPIENILFLIYNYTTLFTMRHFISKVNKKMTADKPTVIFVSSTYPCMPQYNS